MNENMQVQTVENGDIMGFVAPDIMELMIGKWLEEKAHRSTKTREAYILVMSHFREQLQARGLDLFSQVNDVAMVARAYVKTSYDRRGRVRNGLLSEGTINQRYAIISSFYLFCHMEEKRIENPIDLCTREKPNVHDNATHLDSEDVGTILKGIDTSTLQGKRDYALLLLGVTTGRRAAELLALQWGDLQVKGRKLLVTWRHCKGNKTMRDELGTKTRTALEAYVHALYGASPGADAYLFVSLSHNHYGQQMSTQAASNICLKYLGTSRLHTLRHTFAVNDEEAGASLSEISERLGHSGVGVTSAYMKKLHGAENKHIDKLERLYGL